MNAINLLKDDHNELRRLFQGFKASESKSEKHQIFEEVKHLLEIHTHLEETIFYPELLTNDELEDITKEGLEEHHVADLLVREISNLVDDSEKFEPKMEVLIESTEHHIQEEEGEMFPKVEELYSETELEELGERMQEERQSFEKSKKASA